MRAPACPCRGEDLAGVYLNTDFLKAARQGSPLDASGHVVVLGGGNVAYDCARTAVRLGAASVDVCCLEAEDKMTSTPEERAEGAEEGVVLHDAYAFNSINESEPGSGRVGSVTVQKISRFYFDEDHRAVTRARRRRGGHAPGRPRHLSPWDRNPRIPQEWASSSPMAPMCRPMRRSAPPSRRLGRRRLRHGNEVRDRRYRAGPYRRELHR